MNQWIDKSYLRPSLKITRQSARTKIYPKECLGGPTPGSYWSQTTAAETGEDPIKHLNWLRHRILISAH